MNQRPPIPRQIKAVAAVLASFAGAAVSADFAFVDASRQRGIEPYAAPAGFCMGIAAADFDDDGDIDLFVPTEAGVPHQLYVNQGDGLYLECATSVGVGGLERGRAAVFVDVDGDHLLDLVVAGDCNGLGDDCLAQPTLHLYLQGADGVFIDATASAGFGDDLVTFAGQHRGGLAAADLDGDDDLDLVTGLWAGEARVLINDGTGTFDDAGVPGVTGVTRGHWQPLLHDFDGDGDTDLFWAIDFTANLLWLRQDDGTYDEVAADAGLALAWNDMGIAFGDPDNDADLDLFITEITGRERFSVLFRNDSIGSALSYAQVADQAGVDATGFAWGATLLDADLDGALDLAVANGYPNPPHDTDASRFFRNVDATSLAFEDVSSDVGFDDTYRSSGLVSLDVDRDGDLDLVQACSDGGPLRLLENELSGAAADRHWLVVRPRMDGANHRAIGATVRIDTGDRTSIAAIRAGSSICSQEPAEAHFGLGATTSVACVTIAFPDGSIAVRTDVAADQVLTIQAGDCGGDVDCSGTVDVADLIAMLTAWGPCPDCPEDVDGSGVVNVADLVALLTAWGPLCEVSQTP